MADAEEAVDGLENGVDNITEDESSAGKTREDKQLDAVTDYHEDQEIDKSKAQSALSSLASSSTETLLPEESLASIKVRDEDVKLLETELEMSEDDAIQKLRENGNDLKKIFKEFLKV